MEAIKKAEKEGAITEDDEVRMEKEIQDLTDRFVKEIDAHAAKKETEILTV
jgi:ribosome recycling factor